MQLIRFCGAVQLLVIALALGVEIQQAREEHENEANFTQVEVVFWLGNSP